MPLIAAGRLAQDASLTAMGMTPHLRHRAQAFAGAGLLLLVSSLALAQTAPASDKDPGFFGSVGQWFDRQVTGAKDMFGNLGHEAGVAARTTADTAKDAAKDAADTLTSKLPATTVVRGHEVCRIAPNGAPDCDTAANTICKGKGFKAGKSVDMTTAETCPAKVYMAGRSSGPECKTETFVSSAICQ
ncbi:MAG: hypothetical protein ACTHLO_08955 [Pseudolabrys sp.]